MVGMSVRMEGQDLACWRGDRLVFRDVGFALGAGEALVITGGNGRGKSSLLRMVTGLLPPLSGRMLWEGADIRDDLAAHAQRFHYIGHQDAVKPSLSVREHLTYWAALAGQAGAPVDQAMAAFHLDKLAARRGGELSAGQKRRLALARLGLETRPLWLLDEPTVALDRDGVRDLTEAIGAQCRAGGMVVIATHDPHLFDAATLLILGGGRP